MTQSTPTIVVIDNHDSFVYNLTDALHAATRADIQVFRNTVPVDDVLAEQPDLICLSPGPGHPQAAGSLMELVARTAGTVPLLGVCLGFQAIIEHFGGVIDRCGPVHGQSVPMELTDAGLASPVFAGLGEPHNPRQLHVARYHSLGCRAVPAPLRSLATAHTSTGIAVMAAESGPQARGRNAGVLGLQFHPESVLSPTGPQIVQRAMRRLCPAIAT